MCGIALVLSGGGRVVVAPSAAAAAAVAAVGIQPSDEVLFLPSSNGKVWKPPPFRIGIRRGFPNPKPWNRVS